MMKSIQCLLLVIFITMVGTSCHKEKLRAIVTPPPEASEVVELERPVSDFSKVEILLPMEVVFNYSDTEQRVVVETNINIQRSIVVENINDRLIIRSGVSGTSSDVYSVMKVHITSSDLTLIEAPIFSTIKFNNQWVADELEVRLDLRSTLEGPIEANKLELNLESGSEVNLSGTVDSLVLGLDGFSSIRSYDLESNYLIADLSGSFADITVNEELSVIASGGSMVRYKGDGLVISQELSGGSSIMKVD